MNILIATNSGYLHYTKTMLFSLAYNNSDYLDIYLLYSSLSEKEIDDLSSFVLTKCHGKLHPIFIDPKRFDGLVKDSHVSVEGNYRLLVSEILSPEIDRILWLDSDMVINDSISELYNEDLQNIAAVVCRDLLVKDYHYLQDIVDFPYTDPYFNSGVVLFNMELMRAQFPVEKIIPFLKQYYRYFTMLDQDALNVLFHEQVKFCDPYRFNHLMLTVEKVDKERKPLLESAAIIHYVGKDKPSYYKYINSSHKYYWKYEKMQGRYWAWISFCVKHYPYIWARKVYESIKGR